MKKSSIHILGKGKGAVTDWDAATLRWLVRHGAVTAPQVAKWRGRSLAMARRRLAVLENHGMIRRLDAGGRTTIFIATSKGAASAGLGLRPCRVGGLAAELSHALALVDLLEELGKRWRGGIITERQLRADALTSPIRPRGRVPDGVIHRPGRFIAIELDRTPKRSVQLRRLIAGYLPFLGMTAKWQGVLWVTNTKAIARRYRGVVEELNASDVIQVCSLAEVVA